MNLIVFSIPSSSSNTSPDGSLIISLPISVVLAVLFGSLTQFQTVNLYSELYSQVATSWWGLVSFWTIPSQVTSSETITLKHFKNHL
jgi:hypothetical protein